MGLENLGLMQDATSGTTVGGSAITLERDGVDVPNGVHVADMSESDFTIRTNITCKTRNPQLQSDGSYSKSKRWITVVVPKKLASGATAFNLIRIEVEVHPESATAEKTNLHMLGAQVFTDPDVIGFLNTGSLA